MTGEVLDDLALSCPLLEQLDLLGNSQVPKRSITLLLCQCPNLMFLDISFCNQITSEDVDVWRQDYPNVVIAKSFT